MFPINSSSDQLCLLQLVSSKQILLLDVLKELVPANDFSFLVFLYSEGRFELLNNSEVVEGHLALPSCLLLIKVAKLTETLAPSCFYHAGLAAKRDAILGVTLENLLVLVFIAFALR